MRGDYDRDDLSGTHIAEPGCGFESLHVGDLLGLFLEPFFRESMRFRRGVDLLSKPLGTSSVCLRELRNPALARL
jgi:hypothetical protein